MAFIKVITEMGQICYIRNIELDNFFVTTLRGEAKKYSNKNEAQNAINNIKDKQRTTMLVE